MRNGFSAGVRAAAACGRCQRQCAGAEHEVSPALRGEQRIRSPQQKHPPSRGGYDFVISFSPRFLFVSAQFLSRRE